MTTYDPLLAVSLPGDDSAVTARLAEDLRVLADRLGGQGRRVGAMVGVARWSGLASAAADRRLAGCARALGDEHDRLLVAAEAVEAFSRRAAVSAAAAEEARRLLAAARAAQHRADVADPAGARGRSTGHRLDGRIAAPDAVALLDRARAHAVESCSCYDRAATGLVADLTALSGRRVLRQYADRRLLLDLAGFVPVVAPVIDVADVLTYASSGQWDQVAVTVASAVPGPVGWTVTAAGLVASVSRLGDVTGVERTTPQPQVRVPMATQVSQLTPGSHAPTVSAGGPAPGRPDRRSDRRPGRRGRTPPPTSPPQP